MPVIRRSVGIAMAALLAACHKYVPATSTELAPGTRVRIDVPATRPLVIATDTGLATYVNVASLTGRVVNRRGDTLVVREGVLVSAARSGDRRTLPGDVAYVADSSDRLQRQRLDQAATAFAVLVPIGVIVYLLATLEFSAVETGY
jgi:hypothetical protein